MRKSERAPRRKSRCSLTPSAVMPSSLLSEPHLDVAGRDTRRGRCGSRCTCVVGVDVAAGRGFRLVDLEHRLLRAVHHAVVALEALAAAHAALRFRHHLLVGETFQPLLEVPQRLLLRQRDDLALVARRVREVAEEQLRREESRTSASGSRSCGSRRWRCRCRGCPSCGAASSGRPFSIILRWRSKMCASIFGRLSSSSPRR